MSSYFIFLFMGAKYHLKIPWRAHRGALRQLKRQEISLLWRFVICSLHKETSDWDQTMGEFFNLVNSVADLNPQDPYVFGPQGSGSGTCSGSFYNQAKIVRKPLIPTVLWLLYDFLSLKNDINEVRGTDPDPYHNFTDPQHCCSG